MFTDYRPSHGYDEYFSAADQPRAALSPLLSSLGRMGIEQLNSNHAAAAALLKRLGATFRLNDSGSKGVEHLRHVTKLWEWGRRLLRARGT